MKGIHRIRPVLKINPDSTASVSKMTHAVDNGMAKDPVLYSLPAPSLLILKAQNVKLDLAEQLAGTRAKGAAAARNVERLILVGMLETECSYVQTLCDAHPDKAVSIIENVGLTVALVPIHSNPILKVKPGAASGTVNLDAYAVALVGRTGKKSFYNWEWTTDGGKTFNIAPSTPHAKTTIGSLAPLTMVGFRVCVTTGKGTIAWSAIVTILVH